MWCQGQLWSKTEAETEDKRKQEIKAEINPDHKWCRTVKVVPKCQEHIVYTQEPPGSYLTHSEIAPSKGTGKDLAIFEKHFVICIQQYLQYIGTQTSKYLKIIVFDIITAETKEMTK